MQALVPRFSKVIREHPVDDVTRAAIDLCLELANGHNYRPLSSVVRILRALGRGDDLTGLHELAYTDREEGVWAPQAAWLEMSQAFAAASPRLVDERAGEKTWLRDYPDTDTREAAVEMVRRWAGLPSTQQAPDELTRLRAVIELAADALDEAGRPDQAQRIRRAGLPSQHTDTPTQGHTRSRTNGGVPPPRGVGTRGQRERPADAALKRCPPARPGLTGRRCDGARSPDRRHLNNLEDQYHDDRHHQHRPLSASARGRHAVGDHVQRDLPRRCSAARSRRSAGPFGILAQLHAAAVDEAALAIATDDMDSEIAEAEAARRMVYEALHVLNEDVVAGLRAAALAGRLRPWLHELSDEALRVREFAWAIAASLMATTDETALHEAMAIRGGTGFTWHSDPDEIVRTQTCSRHNAFCCLACPDEPDEPTAQVVPITAAPTQPPLTSC